MPLSIEDFRTPKFVKPKDMYPFGEDVSDKFYTTTGDNHSRRYRNGSFPQPGYSPNSNQIEPRDTNINTEDYTLPPY